MSLQYERLKRGYLRLNELAMLTRHGQSGTKALLASYRAVSKRYYASAKKHPLLVRRMDQDESFLTLVSKRANAVLAKMQAAEGNKNPVRRKGGLVIVSGPHSHAYPARKTKVRRGNKNPEGYKLVERFTRGVELWQSSHDWLITRNDRIVLSLGHGYSKFEALEAAAKVANAKRKKRNAGMGVSDLVSTPAYGAFGGAIRGGDYVGGPMRWARRGIGGTTSGRKNPKGSPRVNVRKVGPQMWRVSLPSRYVPGDGVPYGIVEKRGDKFYYSGPTSHGDARYPASSLSNAVLKMLSAHASWIGHGTRQRFMEDKRRGNPLVHGYSRKSIGKNIGRERQRGKSRKQSVAIAYGEARRVARRRLGYVPAALRRNPADKVAARELVLYIENDGDLYRQQTYPIIQNLARKKRKGVFDLAKSVKLWAYLAENGAKKYAREFGGTWNLIFTPDTRRAVAAELAQNYLEAIDYEVKKQSGNKNPYPRNYRQAPPGNADIFASRATTWHALRTAFPGIKNPKRRVTNAVLLRHIAIAADRLRRGVGSEVELRMTKDKARYRGISKERIEAAAKASMKSNPKRRRRNGNGNGMSFWKATIYSPTGKPIHRQVIKNTAAGARASAKALARSHPKVALDGPYKKNPLAC